MSIIRHIKPSFWDHYVAAAGENQIFSFRRKWKLIVLLTSIVALTPLFIMTLIDFIIIAFAIFMVIKWMNSMKKKEEEKPAEPPKPSKEEALLTEIRDELRKG